MSDHLAIRFLLVSLILWQLVLAKKHVRGTTLIAAWWWSMAAGVAVGTVEIWMSWAIQEDDATRVAHGWAAVHFAAAAVTLCPMIAVLGAKRPQHQAWQLIVFSLWCVLVLPAAEAFFVRRGGVIQIHDARGLFLCLLIGVGLINYLPTRYVLSAVFFSLGQVSLFAIYLPILRRYVDRPPMILALSLFLAAALASHLVRRRQVQTTPDRPWLDFFNCFGAFWGLRVAERYNALAAAQNHRARLGWFGFEADDGTAVTGNLEPSAIANLDSLLLRFVSVDWISRRRIGTRDEI